MPAFDLDAQGALVSATVRSALPGFRYKRHDTPLLKWQFIQDNALFELPTGATIIFGVKVKGDFGGGYLASAVTYTKVGSGPSAVYVMLLDLNAAGIEGLFPTETVLEIGLVGEIEVKFEGRRISSVDDIPIVIRNDYNKGGEGGPISGDPIWGLATDYLLKLENLAGLADLAAARANLGLGEVLFRDAVAVPAAFDSAGAVGQYAFDAATYRVWVYLGGQWNYFTLFSA